MQGTWIIYTFNYESRSIYIMSDCFFLFIFVNYKHQTAKIGGKKNIRNRRGQCFHSHKKDLLACFHVNTNIHLIYKLTYYGKQSQCLLSLQPQREPSSNPDCSRLLNCAILLPILWSCGFVLSSIHYSSPSDLWR